MRPCHRIVTSLVAAFVVAPAAAALEDEQLWLNATVTGTTAAGFAYLLEVQPRFARDTDGLGALILRPMAGWRLSDRVTVWGGYAHVVTPTGDASDRSEQRVFGQVSWLVGPVAGGTLSSRTRLEHRNLSDSRDVGWRARELVRWVRPIGRPERTRALVSFEAFAAFNDTDWGARAGFDQLRSFAGVEVPVGGRHTMELGYLNQLVNGRAGVTRVNHVVSLALFIRP